MQRQSFISCILPLSSPQVLPEKRSAVGGAMMGSSHTYDLAGAGAVGGRPGAPGGPSAGAQRADIEVALNPEELDLDPAEMAARYEQGVREQQSNFAKDRQVWIGDRWGL